jgi:hypothetical protein
MQPRRADLDMNQHVNNVSYIGWVLEVGSSHLLYIFGNSCYTDADASFIFLFLIHFLFKSNPHIMEQLICLGLGIQGLNLLMWSVPIKEALHFMAIILA